MQLTYQLMPDLSPEEYTALKADILERGVIVPIEIDETGEILDGHHRLRAWRELTADGADLPDYPRVVRAGMNEAQKRNHVRALNIVRRHLSKDQLKEQWAAMRADGMTYQEIADSSGVAHTTVMRATCANAQVQPDNVMGKDGKARPATYKPRKPKQAPPVSFFATSDLNEEKAKQKAQQAIENGEAAASKEVQVTIFSHESKEYYTPPLYVDAARETMGGIDLDPASCEAAQEWIGATEYFTFKDDGLSKPWHGRVWLNPPYSKTDGRSNQEIWAEKLIEEYESGNVTEAVLLVKAAMGYKWFENLWYDWTVCFARDRLSFIKADGSDEGQSKQGTAFLYFGADPSRFISVFGRFGRVIRPEEGYTIYENE